MSAWLLIPYYKEKAFGMVRGILEAVTLVLLAIVSYMYSCEEAMLPGKISSMKEVINFFTEFSKMLTGSAIQIFGNVLNTMMVGWFHDDNLLIAWVVVINLQAYVFSTGMGISNGLRASLSYELGRGNFKKGREIALLGIFYSFIVGICLSI